MVDIFKEVESNLTTFVENSKKELDSLNAQPVPEYQVDPQLERSVEKRSKEESFEEVKEVLRNAYVEHTIPHDDYYKAIRELSRNYFKKVVIPSLT